MDTDEKVGSRSVYTTPTLCSCYCHVVSIYKYRNRDLTTILMTFPCLSLSPPCGMHWLTSFLKGRHCRINSFCFSRTLVLGPFYDDMFCCCVTAMGDLDAQAPPGESKRSQEPPRFSSEQPREPKRSLGPPMDPHRTPGDGVENASMH